MKRLFVFVLLGISSIGLFFPYEASGKNKKALRSEQTALLIDSLIAEANFKFIPVEAGSSKYHIYKDYGSIEFFPGRVNIDLLGQKKFESFYNGLTPYQEICKEGDQWFINSIFDYHSGKLFCEFVIDRSTGKASLKVSDTHPITALSTKTYTGWIYPN